MSRMKDFLAIIHGGGDEAVEIAQQLMGLSDFTRQDDEPRWIPASARLPDDGTWCWVNWSGPGKPFPALRDSRSAGGWTNSDTWEDFNKEVTHWMPLTEPPEAA